MLRIPKDIEYIFTDFDGVITDGCAYINDENGAISKKVNFKDIMGISIAIKNGYKVGIISGESCAAINYVKEKFNLIEVHCKIRNKLEVLQEIVVRNNLNPQKIIYIGDDINDINALNFVGCPITVANAMPKVKEVQNIQITDNFGGNGAFREVIDSLVY